MAATGTTSGNTQTTAIGIMKDFYRDGKAIDTSYEKHVLWALMTKTRAVPKVGGSAFVHSIIFADSAGDASGIITAANTTNNPTAAQGFAYAQQAGGSTGIQSVEFFTTRYQNNKDFSLSTEVILSSDGPRNAFESAVVAQSQTAVRWLGNRQDIFMHGTGTGVIGQIATTTTIGSSTIQLTNASDAVKFKPGMELDLCSALTGSAPRAYGTNVHGCYVGSVDKTAGTLTTVVSQSQGAATCNINDAANGIPGAATGDYIFARTDYNNVISGVEAWIPYGGPTSTLFYGVNRTLGDVQALAGSWMNASQKSVEEYFIDASIQQARVATEGLTHFIMPWGQWGQLAKSGTAREPVVQETDMTVSFNGVEVLTPDGPATALFSRNCPTNRVYGVNIDTFEFTHLAEPIKLWDYDGVGGLRQPLADGMEYRMFSFGNVVCHQPQNNITLLVSGTN